MKVGVTHHSRRIFLTTNSGKLRFTSYEAQELARALLAAVNYVQDGLFEPIEVRGMEE